MSILAIAKPSPTYTRNDTIFLEHSLNHFYGVYEEHGGWVLVILDNVPLKRAYNTSFYGRTFIVNTRHLNENLYTLPK